MNWKACKNILCIRADNMGDVILTTPALHALKESFDCNITLLTSSMGSLITPFIKEIDDTIIYDLPWVKTNGSANADTCIQLVEKLKTYNFDAAIIFTVYSQNPLPAAMFVYMANIPLRLAYCRENPYDLLTDWIPDEEPYTFIQHQVKRDLNLVKAVGASTDREELSLSFSINAYYTAKEKLKHIGFDANKKFIIAHPGVSEIKREYPKELWSETLNLIQEQTGVQIMLTGNKKEMPLTQSIQQETGENVFSAAGILNIEEFIAVIAHAQLVISVNTATIHIAAAVNTPVIVLYAQTNPQHTPWSANNIIMPFSVPENLKSKNEVIRFVNLLYYKKQVEHPSPKAVAANALMMMHNATINLQHN